MEQPQILVEYGRRDVIHGDMALAVMTTGQSRASGAVPGGEQQFFLPYQTLKRVEAAVGAVPWQQLPPVIGDPSDYRSLLRCAGREVYLKTTDRDVAPGLPGLVVELFWILEAARKPLLLDVMRHPELSGDDRYMELEIGHDGSVRLGRANGSVTGQLEEDELGRITGLLDGMRFVELDIRDQGYVDWTLVHKFNKVVLESDTKPPALTPLLELCVHVKQRLAGELPPTPPRPGA